MDPHDVEATKVLRREFNRHYIDISLADLQVLHGVAYIRGTLSGVRVGSERTLGEEVDHVLHLLKTRNEFRDVVMDAKIRG